MFFLFFEQLFAIEVGPQKYEVLFTPSQKCLPKILSLIKKAQKVIYVQCYSFTSKPIAKALIEAFERGIKIVVVSDKSQIRAKGSVVIWLFKKNIPVYIDSKVAIAHNKIMIIDDEIVLFGSYNWTNAAENRNAENIMICYDESIAKKFIKNFHSRQSASYLLDNVMF